MNLIVNASTLIGTGVSQVAISFIEECKKYPENKYLVFLSENIASNLDIKNFPSQFSFFIFKGKFYNPLNYKNIVKMKRLAADFNPDCVFSIFGPSWWNPKVPHLQGYAYPHYVYPDSPVWSMMGIKEKIKRSLFKLIHKTALLKSGDYFVCETEDVSARLSSYFNISPSKIFTVSNTANSFFRNYTTKSHPRQAPDEFRFFSMCSPYLHKNLGVLNQVIPILRRKNLNIYFNVTLRDDDYNRLFDSSVRDRIRNAGVLKPQDCPDLAASCDALFLPTLLECFSASYPEAMLLEKPILTSDLSFAHNVCGKAALYFNPMDPENIADTIIKLISDKSLSQNLVDEGRRQLSSFSSPSERASKYLEICENISKK